MRRYVALLVLMAWLVPASALAGSFSWSTPWSSGTLSSGSSTALSGSGSVASGSTSVDWAFSLDGSSNTGSATTTVNGQSYSTSFDWSNLFLLLFS